jgi:hypothetical protein
MKCQLMITNSGLACRDVTNNEQLCSTVLNEGQSDGHDKMCYLQGREPFKILSHSSSQSLFFMYLSIYWLFNYVRNSYSVHW